MKILPFITAFLYIVAFLFDVLHEAKQNDILQYFSWLFCYLANAITLYYVIVISKRSKRANKTGDGSPSCKTGDGSPS
jgi:hypothetical protein